MRKIEKVPQVQIPQLPEPVEIRWRDWSRGLNTQDDPRDLPPSTATELTNFDISSSGKIIDVNGYSAALSNIPTGLAIKRVFKYKVTKPSAQDITIVIGDLSGLTKVYAVNTTLFTISPDANGWRDLTQYYSKTAGVGSSGTSILFTIDAWGLVSDAMVGWLVINLDTGKSSIITESIDDGGGIVEITTADNTGAASGHSLVIQRYPLIGYYATGSATDYDLAVSDYDDVSFTLDNEALRINFGADNDQSRGFWFGYIDRYLLDGTQASDTSSDRGAATAGWTCENQEMQRMNPAVLSGVLATPVTADSLPADDYTIRMAYMYDGNQEGPLMDYDASVLDLTVASGDAITYEPLQYLYTEYPVAGTAPPMSLRNGADINGIGMFMSHRITDLMVYLSNDQVNYYLVDTLTLSADSSTGTITPTGTRTITGTMWDARGGEYADRTGFGSYPYIKEDTPTKVMGFCGVQTMVRGRRIVGDMRQPSPEDFNQYVFRIAAAQPHANGTFNNDVFGLGLSEHIDIRTKQADKVMGLEELNGGLLALKENSLHFIDFGGGRMDTWTIAMSNEDVGAVSRRSVCRVPNGVIFAGADNIYYTDGVNTVAIADQWRSTYQAKALAVKQNARAVYYPRKNQYRIAFTDDNSVYVFNLTQKAWTLDLTLGADALDILAGPDGYIYWVDGDDLFLMDDSSASISHVGYMSTGVEVLDPRYIWKIKKVFVTFKETTDVVAVLIYKNDGATLADTLTFTGTGALITRGKRASVEVDNVKLRYVTAVNTDYTTELHELRVVAVPVREKRAGI